MSFPLTVLIPLVVISNSVVILSQPTNSSNDHWMGNKEMRDWMTNMSQGKDGKQGMETRTTMMDSTTLEGNSLTASLDTTTTEGINTVVVTVEGRATVASTEIMAANDIGHTEQLMSRDEGIITKNIAPQKDDNRINDMGYTTTSRGTTKTTSVTEMPMKKPVDMDSGMDSISEGEKDESKYEKSGTSSIISLSSYLVVMVLVPLLAY